MPSRGIPRIESDAKNERCLQETRRRRCRGSRRKQSPAQFIVPIARVTRKPGKENRSRPLIKGNTREHEFRACWKAVKEEVEGGLPKAELGPAEPAIRTLAPTLWATLSTVVLPRRPGARQAGLSR